MGQEHDDYREPGEEPQQFVWRRDDVAAIIVAGIVLTLVACMALVGRVHG